MGRPCNLPWSEEVDELLARLWKDGLSFSDIAGRISAAFDVHVTRNACIGRAHRRGMAESRECSERRAAKLTAPKKPRKARAPRRRAGLRKIKWNADAHDFVPTAASHVEEPSVTDHDIPHEQRRALMELRPGDCRWPIGDPGTADFFFCGAQVIDGKSYCAAHSRAAYQPDSRSRRPWYERERRRA